MIGVDTRIENRDRDALAAIAQGLGLDELHGSEVPLAVPLGVGPSRNPGQHDSEQGGADYGAARTKGSQH